MELKITRKIEYTESVPVYTVTAQLIATSAEQEQILQYAPTGLLSIVAPDSDDINDLKVTAGQRRFALEQCLEEFTARFLRYHEAANYEQRLREGVTRCMPVDTKIPQSCAQLQQYAYI